MPIFWSQKANLKYKPAMVVNESRNHVNKLAKGEPKM